MKLTNFLLLALLALPAFGALDEAPTSGMDSAGVSAFGSPEYRDQAFSMGDRFKEIRLTSTDLANLNATPLLVLATPAVGHALIPTAIYGFNDVLSAAWSSGSDGLELQYTGAGNGTVIMTLPTGTAFTEASSDTYYYMGAESATAPNAYPVSINTGVWVHVGTDMTVGDGDISLRVYYKDVLADLTADNN